MNVILDLLDPRSAWEALGHEFRVLACIRLWRGEDVVRVPLAALFRQGDQWSVFLIVEGRAVTAPVSIDHRDTEFAEVTSGLSVGDLVIAPSERSDRRWLRRGKVLDPP